jgi:crotonobetainyl-CoA:carnitine CoA-transferase CaiB-like acyl-CoA transferase
MLGEHTREVLAEAGYSDAEIDAFVAEGVVEAVSGWA